MLGWTCWTSPRCHMQLSVEIPQLALNKLAQVYVAIYNGNTELSNFGNLKLTQVCINRAAVQTYSWADTASSL